MVRRRWIYVTTSRNLEPTMFANFDNENRDSENLDNPSTSDEDEGGRKKYHKFKMFEVGGLIHFELGPNLIYIEIVRTHVKEYVLCTTLEK